MLSLVVIVFVIAPLLGVAIFTPAHGCDCAECVHRTQPFQQRWFGRNRYIGRFYQYKKEPT